MTGSNHKQNNQSQNSMQQKILDRVDVKLDFPKRLGGDVATIRWITLHYSLFSLYFF